MKTIAILGGKGGFGAWIKTYIESEKKIAKANIICTKTAQENIKAAQQADIIFIAVPIHVTQETIKQIGPHVKKDATIIDVTSIKELPYKWMKKHLPSSCTIIPTHPMFGPSLSILAGQVIVLTPDTTTKKKKDYQIFKNFLIKVGVNIIETTVQEHDEMMAVIQGLTHFTLFVMGETMRQAKVDLKFAAKFISPIYKLMTSSVARYMNQNPELYADIQINNPKLVKMQKIFMKSAQKFADNVKNKDKKSYVQTLKKTQEYFGKEAKKGQEYTDKIIFLLSKQQSGLKNNIGKKIVCENIYTREQKSGKLSSYNSKSIVLDETTKLHINQRIILS